MNKKITAGQYFEQLSSLVLEFIAVYKEDVFLKIVKSSEYKDEPQRFYYTIIHKTLSTLDAANFLLCNFDLKRNWHTPLFILLRPIISDLVIGEYVLWKYEKNRDELEMKKLIQGIYADHIDSILNCLKSAKSIYDWTPEQLEEEKNKLKQSHPDLYDSEGNLKVPKVKTSVRSILKEMASQTNSKSGLFFLQTFF